MQEISRARGRDRKAPEPAVARFMDMKMGPLSLADKLPYSKGTHVLEGECVAMPTVSPTWHTAGATGGFGSTEEGRDLNALLKSNRV